MNSLKFEEAPHFQKMAPGARIQTALLNQSAHRCQPRLRLGCVVDADRWPPHLLCLQKRQVIQVTLPTKQQGLIPMTQNLRSNAPIMLLHFFRSQMGVMPFRPAKIHRSPEPKAKAGFKRLVNAIGQIHGQCCLVPYCKARSRSTCRLVLINPHAAMSAMPVAAMASGNCPKTDQPSSMAHNKLA